MLQFKVFQRDAFTCVYCGEMGNTPGVELHADHIKPRAHFPSTAPNTTVNASSNLITSCETCNGAKGPQNLAGFATMLRERGLAATKIKAMLRRVRAALRREL